MKYAVEIKGRDYVWHVYVQEAAVEDMRADGIEVMEVYNTIPVWVVDWGLLGVWCAAQDAWNWPSRMIRGLKK